MIKKKKHNRFLNLNVSMQPKLKRSKRLCLKANFLLLTIGILQLFIAILFT